MKSVLGCLLLCLTIFALGACTNAQKASPVIGPIASVGCSIETAVTNGMAQSVATALTCTNVSVIQTSLQVAFGNANLCTTATSAQAKAAGLKTDAVSAKGIVGNIACPIAINTVIGYMTNSIPTTWGCTAGTSAAALATALTAACEAAIPL